MKIIKDADGVYVNLEKATAFYVMRQATLTRKTCGFDACLFIGELKFTLRRFDNEAEAKAYLDEFVTELNDAKELKCQRHADNLKIIDAVINRLEAIP